MYAHELYTLGPVRADQAGDIKSHSPLKAVFLHQCALCALCVHVPYALPPPNNVGCLLPHCSLNVIRVHVVKPEVCPEINQTSGE